MNRFKELQKILESGKYFKVVCGAGNENTEEVYRLSMIYTLAGATAIDISANVQVVQASMRGINRAFTLAPELNLSVRTRPFINVSVGLKGDPHVRKARINDELCVDCGKCRENCDQKAISFFKQSFYKVNERRCIGCGKCEEVCEVEAIIFFTKKVDFFKILPKCIEAGAETLELHATIADSDLVTQNWKILDSILKDQYISMCLDRSQLSDSHLADRISKAQKIVGHRLIIQADGSPMSGGDDTFNTTLQAIACADLVQKSNIPAKILVSGGTNSKTGTLAKLCDLNVHGISIGTYARNLVRTEIHTADFDCKYDVILSAVNKAKQLIEQNITPIHKRELKL